jgi:glycosyltransferase involved in cell wall biosynthesis
MNLKPEISVIIPVLNPGEHFSVLVESIQRQSYANFEIILVDDGSTDGTLELISKISEEDTRFTLYQTKGSGPSVARNLGLAKARGNWITFVDADDWIAPDLLQKMFELSIAGKWEVIIGSWFTFTESPEIKDLQNGFKTLGNTEYLTGREWIKSAVRSGKWAHYVWLQFIDRRLIERHQLQFVPDILHEDILWTLQLALVANKVGFSNMPFYGYRKRHNSITNSSNEEFLMQRGTSYIHIMGCLIDHANASKEKQLRRALLSQLNVEAGQFLGIMRHNGLGKKNKGILGSAFLDRNIFCYAFCGSRNFSQAWAVIRCFILCSKFKK